MEFAIAIALDLLTVCIIWYCARSAAKKGFARTVIQMLAYILVVMASSFLSKLSAPLIYDHLLRPIVLQEQQEPGHALQNAALVSMLPRGLALSQGGGPGLDSLKELLPEDFDPKELVGGLLPDGLDPEGLAEELIDELEDSAIRPVAVSAISMVGFVVLFTVFSLLANMLLSALGVINHLPLIGPVNALMGGLVGITEGMLIVLVLAVLLRGLLYLHPGGWWVFSEPLVDRTWLFRYFYHPGALKELLEGLAKMR